MENIFNSLIQYGALGCVAAVSLYQVWVMQKKLFDIIEKNTIALTKMITMLEEINEGLRYESYSVRKKIERGQET
jgi:hypothetical protein